MTTGSSASQQDTTHDAAASGPARPPARRSRIGAFLRREQGEEDGVFRPVRLPLWIDLGISAAIIVSMAVGFAGFIYFLARTQGR